MFPLIQLPRKSEDVLSLHLKMLAGLFPLIQLPRKSEVMERSAHQQPQKVSINSTSEEVRRMLKICLLI